MMVPPLASSAGHLRTHWATRDATEVGFHLAGNRGKNEKANRQTGEGLPSMVSIDDERNAAAQAESAIRNLKLAPNANVGTTVEILRIACHAAGRRGCRADFVGRCASQRSTR